MSDLDDLEEIAEQTTVRGNTRTKQGRRRYGVGPNIEHHAVARPLIAAPDCGKTTSSRAFAPNAMPEILMVADHGEVIAVVRRHQDITEVFRLMKERLGLTNAFIDDAGGLTGGHTDKILGPSESKSWGPTTFDLFCEMFAIEFRVHVDMAAVKRMEQVWEGRKRPAEYSETKRVSAKLIEKAKPHVLHGLAKVGNQARNAMLTGEHRSQIARKAAKSRWRKHRKRGCVAAV